MEVSSLTELYSQVNKHFSKVFVVPLIRFDFPKTDYLYLLYKEFFNRSDYNPVKSISVFDHYRFVLAAIFNRNTILHYHWLEFQSLKALSGMPYKLLSIALYKLLGGNIVWTIHNLTPHDKKFLTLHKFIHRWMARRASLIHIHSHSALSLVSDYLKIDTNKILILRHPEFPYKKLSKEEALKEFLSNYGDGRTLLKKPIFLIFGGISEYKGIREIVAILSSQEKQFTLIIAGYVKLGQENLHNFIIENTIDDSRIIYVPTFIPEKHYPSLLHASDICVFNYDDILTSGGVAMAIAYKKRIIAPSLGCLRDFKNNPDVFLFNSKNELKNLIQESLGHFNDG